MCVEIDFVICDEVYGDLMEVVVEVLIVCFILVLVVEYQIIIFDFGSVGCVRIS